MEHLAGYIIFGVVFIAIVAIAAQVFVSSSRMERETQQARDREHLAFLLSELKQCRDNARVSRYQLENWERILRESPENDRLRELIETEKAQLLNHEKLIAEYSEALQKRHGLILAGPTLTQ